MAVIDQNDLTVFFRELEIRDRVSAEEKQAILESVEEVRTVPARTDIARQGDRMTRSTLLLSGMIARYAELADGKRQITALHVAGDFVDLHSFPLKVMDHSVATIVQSRVAFFGHAALERITERFPHLTRLLWMMTLIDAARHRQWLAAMGALPALKRTAHLICELGMRLSGGGVHPPDSIRLPITQAEFAETLGLSVVHTNRTVQTLRNRGLIQWERDTMRILDWDALMELGEFTSTFLHFEKLPR